MPPSGPRWSPTRFKTTAMRRARNDPSRPINRALPSAVASPESAVSIDRRSRSGSVALVESAVQGRVAQRVGLGCDVVDLCGSVSGLVVLFVSRAWMC